MKCALVKTTSTSFGSPVIAPHNSHAEALGLDSSHLAKPTRINVDIGVLQKAAWSYVSWTVEFTKSDNPFHDVIMGIIVLL